jgi:hypothetical protein
MVHNIFFSPFEVLVADQSLSGIATEQILIPRLAARSLMSL